MRVTIIVALFSPRHVSQIKPDNMANLIHYSREKILAAF